MVEVIAVNRDRHMVEILADGIVCRFVDRGKRCFPYPAGRWRANAAQILDRRNLWLPSAVFTEVVQKAAAILAGMRQPPTKRSA